MTRPRRTLAVLFVFLSLGIGLDGALAQEIGTSLPCDELCRAFFGSGFGLPAQPAPAQTVRVRMRNARVKMVDYYYYLHEDCSEAGQVDIQVVEPPRAGLVAENAGMERAVYPAQNVRSACNGRRVRSSRLFYLRNPGAVVDDDFTVLSIYPDNTFEQTRYRVSRR